MEDDYADNETARLYAVVDASPEDGAVPHAIDDVNDDDNDGATDVAPYGYAGYGNYYEALQVYGDDDNDDGGYEPINDADCVGEDTAGDAVPADIGDLLPAYSPDDDGECADQDLGSDDTYDLAFDAFYAASLVAPLGDEQDVVSLGQQVSDAVIPYPDDHHVGDDLSVNVGGDDDANGYSVDQPVDATEYMPDATPSRVNWPLDAHPFAAYIDDAVNSDDDNEYGVVIDDRTWHDDVTEANDWAVGHVDDNDSPIADVAPATDGHVGDDDIDDDNNPNAVPIACPDVILDTHSVSLCVPSTGCASVDETQPEDLVANASETGAGISHMRHPEDHDTAPLAADACLLLQEASADAAIADNAQGLDSAVVDDQAPAQTVESPDGAPAVDSTVDMPGDDSDDQKAIAAFAPIAVADPSPAADEADDHKAIASFEPITAPTAVVDVPAVAGDAAVEVADASVATVVEAPIVVVDAPVTAVAKPEPVATPPAQAAPAEATSWWSPWSWWSGKSAPAGTASAASDARLKAPGLVLTKADLDSVRLRPVAARGPRPSPVAEPVGVLGQLLGLFGGVASSSESAEGVDLSSPPSVRALVAAMESAGRASD
ncbi:RNase E G incomplete domain containing protein [Pandoravirus quercus]|uniref:RNase E G incomplete domain containing protein n=1 Tax=Pandoravirus quercus TaxID=2107709 RepID=A0A2U7U986_9VIRU|nr:RNase E G incomplete domain containing protein [Pandoravirus quercus]AVK74994.1 RNase E G incomplete domain containing protein [Pandoravirus quercus]